MSGYMSPGERAAASASVAQEQLNREMRCTAGFLEIADAEKRKSLEAAIRKAYSRPRRIGDLRVDWPVLLVALIAAALTLAAVILYLVSWDSSSALGEVFTHFDQNGYRPQPDDATYVVRR